MVSTRAGIQWVLVIAAALCVSVGHANEVSWITGQNCAPGWTIDPAQPRDTDTIRFSGPVRFYLNQCVAEKSLGGKPTLFVNHEERTIELRFLAPPSNDCTEFWSPVCGLRGSVGPLEAGQWQLFSHTSGAAFSLEFAVEGATILSVRYVDANAPGAQNGSSWKDAINRLQDALVGAREGTEIRVAQGTYCPDVGADIEPGDQHAMFRLNEGVVLKGGYAGWRGTNPNARDVRAFPTILSGDLFHDDKPLSRLSDMLGAADRWDNSYHIVSISGTDAAAALDGFTITAGTDTDTDLPDELGGGGGIYNDSGNATIRNCLIIGNGSLYRGGGFYCRGNCTVVLIDCTIADNWSKWSGGGLYYHWSSNVVLNRCVITGNGAEFQGGGICSHGGGQLLVSNSLLSGNRGTDPTWSAGGALYGSGMKALLNHCTLVGNRAAFGTAMAFELFDESDAGEIHLSNCIVWGDPNLIYGQEKALMEITDSDVRGGWAGRSNIDVDPCFVEMGSWSDAGTVYDPCDDAWTNGDYRLRWASRCVDTGNLEATWDPNGMDLGGQPRASGLTVDIGAYELRNDPPLADAGPDAVGFTLHSATKGMVTLDASRSYDPEGQPLRYRWYYNDELVGEQALFTTELLAGVYRFKVVVSDPTGQTESDETTATVTLVVNTKTFISPQKLPRNGTQDVLAMTVLPKGKFPKDFDTSEPLRLFPGGVAAVKQSAFIWLSGDTMVLGTFKHADVMAAVSANGLTEMRIVGRLKDGQYFSAVDKVTIK